MVQSKITQRFKQGSELVTSSTTETPTTWQIVMMQKMQSRGHARKYPDTLFEFSTLSRSHFGAAYIHMLSCNRDPVPFETQIDWCSLKKKQFGICLLHVFIHISDAQKQLNVT